MLRNIKRKWRKFWFEAFNNYEYAADTLAVSGRTMAWRDNERFASAWKKAAQANAEGWSKVGDVPDVRWRAHVCCWAAENALKMGRGDFVECGVHTGLLSLTVLHYLKDHLPERFWLFDTFEGVPIEGESEDFALAKRMNERIYSNVWDLAVRNFGEFDCAKLVRGKLPGSLKEADIKSISYLSIDLNVMEYERDTIIQLWPKVEVGGTIVLDDYGWSRHKNQHDFWNDFAAQHGQAILTLPTAQGLIIKR